MSLCSPFLSPLIAFVPSKPENLISLDGSMLLAENALINVSYKLIAFLEEVNLTFSINVSAGKFVSASTYRTNNAISDLLASSERSSARTVTSPVAKISFKKFHQEIHPKLSSIPRLNLLWNISHFSEHLTDA